MTINPGQFAKWAPQHQQAILGKQATAFKGAHGTARQQILLKAYADYKARKAPAPSLPHPGYSNSQLSQLVQQDPNLVALRQAGAQGKQGLANANSYYDQYRQALETARGQSNAGYGTAVANTNAQTAGGRTLDTADAQKVLAAAAQDAASRGQTVDPQLAATFANATASRAAQGNAYGSLQGTLGANANTYLAGRGATAVGQKTQYGLNELANQAAIARQYGSTKSGTALKLSSQLQSDATDAQLKQAALGNTVANTQIREQTAASTAADRAASRKLATKKFDSAQAKDTYERQHHLGPYKPAATPKTKGGFTPQQVATVSNKAVDAINAGRTLIRTTLKNYTDAQIRQAFAQGYYTTQTPVRDPLTGKVIGQKTSRVPLPKSLQTADYVNSALDIERLGGLGKVNVQRLHARHVKIGKRLPVGVTKGTRANPGGDVQSTGGYQGVK